MPELAIGAKFPAARLSDLDGAAVEFPEIFFSAPATVVFFYRGRW
jgi:hypothetical protein